MKTLQDMNPQDMTPTLKDALERLAQDSSHSTPPKIYVYTDGACSGNPGPGGWGALIKYGESESELSGGESPTTNNRMEMLAAIKALEALPCPCAITLTTDSQYLKEGITRWMANWKKNGWKTADKKPVKNQDLWLALDHLITQHTITWEWVKGHSGHVHNERADALARNGIIAQQIQFQLSR